ncbi:MAG: PEP-CTERM sorting domain-containing protein [Armatimonadetes bacterium]|nr:PEP-CTERM sorting domain-containing protein [Armatimonadota bacterium]
MKFCTKLLFLAAVMAPLGAQALTIGGWSTTRGGSGSIVSGIDASQFRGGIEAAFAGVMFANTDTLTQQFLSGIDVLMISSTVSGNQAITPLSTDEQNALASWVASGGCAIIYADNDTFSGAGSDAANESLIDPFGMDISGTANNAQHLTITDVSNPIANGAHGATTGAMYLFPGAFDSIGTGTSVGVVDAFSKSGLVAFAPGSFGAGSGGVVVFSDASPTFNGFTDDGFRILSLNSIDYVCTVPEPASLAIFGIGLAALRKRRTK